MELNYHNEIRGGLALFFLGGAMAQQGQKEGVTRP